MLTGADLPFSDRPFRLTMGLKPLAEGDWLQVDERYADELDEKDRLHRTNHADVFAALAAARDACEELRVLVVDELQRVHGVVPRSWPDRIHPLEAAGRSVQEDLCVMLGDPLVLAAASVCFPSRWRMTTKIGLPTAQIHGPVPFYDSHLGDSVDTVLERLRSDRPVWRSNWSVYDDPALFQPDGGGRSEPNRALTAANAGERLWVRIERQTLRRLPATGAVVFTIRIHQHRLDTLVADRDALSRLAVALRLMPEAMATYKSLPAFREPLLEWVDAALA